jgi:hypothetical protein
VASVWLKSWSSGEISRDEPLGPAQASKHGGCDVQMWRRDLWSPCLVASPDWNHKTIFPVNNTICPITYLPFVPRIQNYPGIGPFELRTLSMVLPPIVAKIMACTRHRITAGGTGKTSRLRCIFVALSMACTGAWLPTNSLPSYFAKSDLDSDSVFCSTTEEALAQFIARTFYIRRCRNRIFPIAGNNIVL